MSTDETPESLIKQAVKYEKKWSIFSKYDNKEKAIELYMQAAAFYKNTNQPETAANTYEYAAGVANKINDKDTVCKCYNNAADIYNICGSYDDAIKCLKSCVKFSTMDIQTAKYYKTIGEIQEKNFLDEEAYKSYETAERYYRSVSSFSQANNMLLKLADYNALKSKYIDAYQMYNTLVESEKIIYFTTITIMFKACLCAIASVPDEEPKIIVNAKPDEIGIKINKISDILNGYEFQYGNKKKPQSSTPAIGTAISTPSLTKFDNYAQVINKIDEYKSKSTRFQESNECMLLENCLYALIDNEVDQFTNLITKFLGTVKSDKIFVSVFTKIKKMFKQYKSADIVDLIGDEPNINTTNTNTNNDADDLC